MRKIILGIFLILISSKSFAQGWSVQAMNPTTTVNSKGGFAVDSTLRIPFRLNVKPNWWNVAQTYNGAIQINSSDGSFYWYYNNAWRTFIGGSADSVTFYTNYRADTSRANIYAAISSGGGSMDSVKFATQYRLDTVKANRVRYIDTAAMLTPYLRKADTTAMLGGYLRKVDTNTLSNRINTKLNIVDTANIRLRAVAGANMSITGTYPNLTFASSGGGGSADSITFATNYRIDTAKVNLRTSINTKLNSADTNSLSTRIDARVKYSDTAAMLSNYYRTATSTAALALKVNYTDTATMLTPYLRKGDTTAMLGGYLRKVDTNTLSNRINLKANIASPTFTGTVTIPTGANITTPNILSLTSGTTNDSIVVADATSGALKRISSSRIGGGGGSGWGLTGNSGTTAGTNFIGTTDASDLWFKRNNVIGGYISSTSTALGNEATFTYQAASNVTAIGAGALRANLNSNNTAVGQDAARGNTTGSNNTAIGMSALYSNTGNGNSTAIGYFSGLQSTGASNIFVGASAGFATTSASKSIVISASGELASNTTANQVNLGNVIWASDASGTSNTPLGRVSIGTNTPNARALLELSNAGTTKGGFKLPTFTTAERDAISWVAGDAGMMIWNSTTTKAQVWTGSAWADLH